MEVTRFKKLKKYMMIALSSWIALMFMGGFVVAPLFFSLAKQKSEWIPNSSVAAEKLGPLLCASDVVSLVLAVAIIGTLYYLRKKNLLALASRYYVSEVLMSLTFVAACLNYFVFSPQLNMIQEKLKALYGGFHLADKTHPLYLEFSSTHSISFWLFAMTLVLAIGCLICVSQIQINQRQPLKVRF